MIPKTLRDLIKMKCLMSHKSIPRDHVTPSLFALCLVFQTFVFRLRFYRASRIQKSRAI